MSKTATRLLYSREIPLSILLRSAAIRAGSGSSSSSVGVGRVPGDAHFLSVCAEEDVAAPLVNLLACQLRNLVERNERGAMLLLEPA